MFLFLCLLTAPHKAAQESEKYSQMSFTLHKTQSEPGKHTSLGLAKLVSEAEAAIFLNFSSYLSAVASTKPTAPHLHSSYGWFARAEGLLMGCYEEEQGLWMAFTAAVSEVLYSFATASHMKPQECNTMLRQLHTSGTEWTSFMIQYCIYYLNNTWTDFL